MMKKHWKKALPILALLLAAAFCIYVYAENTTLTVSEYDITSARLPQSFDGFRVVQVSDFHNNHNEHLTNQLVRAIEASNPDIILLTGDMIDSRLTNVDVTVDFIERIKDIAPIYYVVGNHEARTGARYALIKQMRALGVAVMSNSTATLRIDDSEIMLIGIDDPNMAHEYSVADATIVQKELTDLFYDGELYSILLSHRPELMSVYADKEIDLAFTGHAHGGLIRLPFIGGLVAPNQGLFPTYSAGRYEKSGTTMIVSRGIGNSGYTFRVNNRPELVVAVLHSDMS